MRALKTHDDRDVRRVASGIEFVLTSPDLNLSKNSFQSFDIEKLDEIKVGGVGCVCECVRACVRVE